MSNDVTRILTAIDQGDQAAAEELLPIVYLELRKLAAQKLSGGKPGQSIQPTMLVHEAYVRLVDVKEPQQWNSRGHFFGAAAEAMRRILVEHARRKQTQKRQATYLQVDPNQFSSQQSSQQIDLIALDEALSGLAEKWPEKCKLVELRYFAGLTVAESAELLGISVATAERHWTFARTWLHKQLKED
jgi:RNA polymerase sigma factor (TIGR02999 family)